MSNALAVKTSKVSQSVAQMWRCRRESNTSARDPIASATMAALASPKTPQKPGVFQESAIRTILEIEIVAMKIPGRP